LLPDCLFENNYGPTEVAVWAVTHLVHHDGQLPSGSTPIGRPIPGTDAHLLDPSLDPVTVGQAGELFLHGGGMARGYHRRPGLTADRFRPNPFANCPGARMYRTGDLVRELPDGALEFLGRRDAQVKVRGHRIELGEVEAALLQHPDVVEAAVDVQAYTGEPVLVAYVRCAPGRRCPDVALRAHLSPILPAAMLPSRYVHVDALPRLVSGKVDRSALRARQLSPAVVGPAPDGGDRR
jgi:acyl-coenzyme A synthetase/AMP-(fatty) acid ligase